MENQEITIPIKPAQEKTGFLAKLRTNKVISLVLAGGVFFGDEGALGGPRLC